MTQKPHNPVLQPPAREDRVAAALRDNLRKRKAQQAARKETGIGQKADTR
jgi:hypothetical protein